MGLRSSNTQTQVMSSSQDDLWPLQLWLCFHTHHFMGTSRVEVVNILCVKSSNCISGLFPPGTLFCFHTTWLLCSICYHPHLPPWNGFPSSPAILNPLHPSLPSQPTPSFLLLSVCAFSALASRSPENRQSSLSNPKYTPKAVASLYELMILTVCVCWT